MKKEKTLTLTYVITSKDVFTTSIGEQIARVNITGPNGDSYLGEDYSSPISPKIDPKQALKLAEQNAIHEMFYGLYKDWFGEYQTKED